MGIAVPYDLGSVNGMKVINLAWKGSFFACARKGQKLSEWSMTDPKSIL